MKKLLFTAAAALLALSAHATDEALVVGVDKYPGLRPGSNLEGCANDAKLMEGKLGLYGFKVTALTNEQASKAGILAALKEIKARLKPGDKFTFYFAGHGTVASGGDSVILTNTSSDGSESGDISCTELYQAVRAVPARIRTILLDSCHSGGMVRGFGRTSKLKPRVYVRSTRLRGGEKSWQTVKVGGADDNGDITKGGGVCYFTAALKTQVANETELDGERHGVFTYNLAQKLTGQRDFWKDISATVSAGVAEATEGEQKPVLSPISYLEARVFEPGAGEPKPSPGPGPKPQPKPEPPKPAPTTTTLDKLYNLSCPDPSRVKLTMTPELSPVPVGQTVRFQITVGMDGYLVLVNKDPEGKLEVLWPQQGQSASASQVRAGQVIRLPNATDEAMTPDAAGTDGLKAILFSSKEAAEALVSSFSSGPMDIKSANKAWTKVKVPAEKFFTSELITQIVGR